MVDALRSPALAPPRGPPSTFLSIDSGRAWVYSSDTTHGAHHQRFFALMVGAPRSTAPALPRGGPLLTFLSIDSGRSQVYSSGTSQGAHRRCFLALMGGAPGSLALTPPMGPAVDVS
jgi:hypothetical protein